MRMKKLISAATALASAMSLISIVPGTAQTYAAEVVYNGFEANYDGWYGNADFVQLTAEEGTGFGATRGMTVTGRTDTEDGAASSKGFYLVGGVEYNYSVKVYSETDETFRLTLLTKDEETDEETVSEIASQEVKAGQWTEISTKYTAPKNSYEFLLTIKTDSTNDFVFDDVTITERRSGLTASAATTEKGLKDEFADYFRVGNILNGGTVKNSAITANIIKDFNSIECENETKPDGTMVKSTSSGNNVGVSLSGAAAIFDFCIQHNIAVRGHTMVWHSQTPSWVFKTDFNDNGAWVDKNTMDARMESYIKNMFNAIETQYPDLNLYAYDICNECVSDDYNRTANYGGAREAGDSKIQGQGGKSAWVQIYGDNSFVEKAFTYARKYAPEGCDLYYNDYNEYWDHKRDCIYNMCKNLYQKGLLDGVGMQSHVPANATGFAGTDSYIEAMEKYLSIGCDVQITELDISLLDGNGNKTYTLQDQATKYQRIFQAAMDWNDNPKSDGRVTAVCIWGPNDANSWLKAGSDALLYDSNNQPKLAYTTLTSMIPQSEWGDGSQVNYGGKNIEPDENGWYFHSTFEGSLDSWDGRGAADVLTSGRTAYAGKEALLVENRTASWNGTSRNLSPAVFKPGEEYSFSVNVSYFDGAASTDFKFTLQYKGTDGKTYYSEIASGTGFKGEWVQLANTNYKIPEGASDMVIYVETSDDTTNNFYIDEAIGAVAGTVIDGAGQSSKLIIGDVTGDQRIDVYDMILARKGLAGTVLSTRENAAADVDQSGKYEINDLVLLSEYLIGKIKEFPVAEKVIDTTAMDQLFKSITVGSSWKNDGENNPLTTQRFGADPGWMVYKDRLYIYTTNDAFEYNGNGQIRENTYDVGTINCVSTADMVNWTDHGAIPVAGLNGRTTGGAASWATCSWAPDACWKTIDGKDKFFLYFANSGGGIGVLTADSPTGPWTDPLGHALLTSKSPNCGDVVWMFDPGVYYDPDTDEAYLFFGGGVDGRDKANPKTGRVVKLGKDMISLDGTPQTMETPYLFEDSSVIKIGDTWYYSYCANWNVPGGNNINGVSFNSADIVYMTSKNPLGPWTSSNVAGMVFGNTGSQRIDNGGNNHHSIMYFKGKYYVAYHSRQQALRMEVNAVTKEGKINKDGNYRSTQINEAKYDASTGKITCSGDMKGVSQIEALDPFAKVQAETMSNQSKDIAVSGVGDTTVSGTKGSWLKASGVDFASGENKLTVRASSKNGAVIKVCTGSATGTAMTYVEIPAGGKMDEITVPVISPVTGSKDLYFVFSGDLNFDYWQFS